MASVVGALAVRIHVASGDAAPVGEQLTREHREEREQNRVALRQAEEVVDLGGDRSVVLRHDRDRGRLEHPGHLGDVPQSLVVRVLARRQHDGRQRQPWEWFAFAGIDGRLIAHNIFLDGSLFRGGPGVARRDAVHDLTAGVSLRYEQVRFSMTRVKRSEEFTTPFGGSGKQRFYSINVGIEF